MKNVDITDLYIIIVLKLYHIVRKLNSMIIYSRHYHLMIKRYLKIDIPWEIGGNDLKVHTERGKGGGGCRFLGMHYHNY